MSLKNAIGFSFIFLAVYSIVIISSFTQGALFLLGLSPVLVIWLVFKTLKDPYTPTHTFEERFYEDYDYNRNQ
ncbi:hypothetical protein [Owenweeksia hongkongensis]|uniref:hypothetical protein n=1 Tax=Owenweeksia hongkongensis TaxID=253245 RepID=UPI003A8FCCC5